VIGKVISHYKIVEKLGEGGMGAVYRAEDTKLRRSVALKCLPFQLASDETAKQRFVHEAQASSALNHPNIATIYYMFEEEEQEFICMEYVEGHTLTELLAVGPLSIERALDITIQVADGLSEAHKKGIIHRDIKAENIMVTPRGLVKIMDFGLAKLKGASRLTKTGSTIGTAAYMSPEQAQGLEVDARTDIFSLGVVFYEMLAGKCPFIGEHEAAILYSLLNEDPEPVETIPDALAPITTTILEQALHKDKKYRYQTMEAMLNDLKTAQKVLEGTPAPGTPSTSAVPDQGEIPIDPELLVGKTLGNYQIVEEVGRGGMGIVYKALQISLNREVALKVLPKQYSTDPEFVNRFRREAKAAASLNHQNIVQIYEIGHHGGVQYFVMEYIEGTNLKSLVEREAPLPLPQTIDIIWDVCNALDFAHKRNVVHRDIKPHNIMISRSGEIKVFDFGIAKAADSSGLTTTGTSIGTPQYMSPEQARGEKEIDGRADLYSLGVVFYEMLVGKVPFDGSTAVGTMYRHVNETPEPPSKHNPNVPDDIDRIVNRMLHKEKQKRYQTGQEIIEDLRPVRQSFSTLDGDLSKGKIARRKRRRPAFALFMVLLLLLLSAAPLYYFIFMNRYDFILKTEPVGASVYEGESLLGVTPLKLTKEEIGVGDHILEVSMPGYADEVYAFSLRHGEKIDLVLPLTQSFGSLRLSSEPPGAKVFLENIYRGDTPFTIHRLHEGIHAVTMSYPGYISSQDTIGLKTGSADSVHSVLIPIPATLFITSVPESAHVFIDSLIMETRTPVETALQPGSHQIQILKEGYLPVDSLMTLDPGEDQRVVFNLQSIEEVIPFGSMNVTAIPWAEVFLNDQYLGSTRERNTFDNILPGTHQVRLTCSEYPPFEQRVTVQPNKQVTIIHNFTATGWLNVSCINENNTPVFGEIWINGQSYGNTPKVIRDLFVGTYKVEIIASGYLPQTRMVTITAEQGQKVQFRMRSSQ
jgi:serine/threonine protein kinase